MNVISVFARKQEGATSVEYAMIAGVLVVAVLAGSLLLGGEVTNLYDSMGDQAGVALGGSSAE